MRIEQLTDKDRKIISETPFLRMDKMYYPIQYFALVLILLFALLAPISGPRVRPLNWEAPNTLADYFSRLWPYLVIVAFMAIVPLADILIRWAELRIGTKKIKELKVKRKWTIRKWTVVIFDPFHMSIFRYFYQLSVVNPGDVIIAELTSVNRIIDFKIKH